MLCVLDSISALLWMGAACLLADLEQLLRLVGHAVDAPLRHVQLELAQVGLHLEPHLLLERDQVAQRLAELERSHRRRRGPPRHFRRRRLRRFWVEWTDTV